MRKRILISIILVNLVLVITHAQQTVVTKTSTAQMNSFISSLMKKMTIDEKIGQLNLLTPGGGIATGAVVSSDVVSPNRSFPAIRRPNSMPLTMLPH